MKRYLKVGAACLLIVALSLQPGLSVKAWEEVLSCTVLGDSIAKGYSEDKVNPIECYGKIASNRVAKEDSIVCDYSNYAVNGLDTQGLNEKILVKDTVMQSLNKADLIFITMGSNDLLNEFKKVSQELLNSDTKFRSAGQAMSELQDAMKKNPLIILKVIDALGSWDYTSFEARWAEAMEKINQQRQDDAQMIVTNIYNPIYNMNLPGTMNKVVEDIIGNMNGIIEKRAEEFGYQVVDLFDSNVVAFVQGDGLHPSQEGQQLIAEMVYEKIADPDVYDSATSVDGLAVKGESSQDSTSPETTKQEPANPEIQPDTTKQTEKKEAESKSNQTTQTKKKTSNAEKAVVGILVLAVGITSVRIFRIRKS